MSEQRNTRSNTPKEKTTNEKYPQRQAKPREAISLKGNTTNGNSRHGKKANISSKFQNGEKSETGDVIVNNEIKKNPTRKPKTDNPLKDQPNESGSGAIKVLMTNDQSRNKFENRKVQHVESENALLQEIRDLSGNWKDGVKALQEQSRGSSRESATGDAWELKRSSGVYRKLPFHQTVGSNSYPSKTSVKKDGDDQDQNGLNKKSTINLLSKSRQPTKPSPELSEGLPLRQQERVSKTRPKTDAIDSRITRSSNKPKQPKPIWNATARTKGKSKTELAKAYAQGVARLQTFTPKPSKQSKVVVEEEKDAVEFPRAPSRIDEDIINGERQEDENNKSEADEDIPIQEHRRGELKIEVSNSNISDLDVEVIVSIDNEDLQGTSQIAQELDAKGGEDFAVLKTLVMQMCQQTIPEWEFFIGPGDGDLTCERVFHANVPSLHKTKNQASWCSHLGILVWNLMTRADYMGFSSMAIPLLGSGESGAPASFIVPVICNEIQSFKDGRKKGGYLSKIVIVHPQDSVTKQIESRLSLQSVPCVKSSSTYKKCPFCNKLVDKTSRENCQITCKHLICKECAKKRLSNGTCMCPVCSVEGKVVKGTQPKGFMLEAYRLEDLPGYRNCGTIHLCYLFGDGTQEDCHPNPGRRYRGVSRYAFLPDNRQGRNIYRLLRRAFDLGLTFTIQRSTTGQEDMIVWCDIPHKVNIHGGPSQSGYPDPGYLSFVERELQSKGIFELANGTSQQNSTSQATKADDKSIQLQHPCNLSEI